MLLIKVVYSTEYLSYFGCVWQTEGAERPGGVGASGGVWPVHEEEPRPKGWGG